MSTYHLQEEDDIQNNTIDNFYLIFFMLFII